METKSDFVKALSIIKEEDDRFIPLIEAFNDIKKTLVDNFIDKEKVFNRVTTKTPKWFGLRHKISESVEEVEICKNLFENISYKKLPVKTHPWLYIQYVNCAMTIGETGKFKDSLMFVPRRTFDLSNCPSDPALRDFDFSKPMTIVEFYVDIIRIYKKFLKVER